MPTLTQLTKLKSKRIIKKKKDQTKALAGAPHSLV